MKHFILLLAALFALGCSALRMLPKGPVIDDERRQEVWGDPAAPAVEYDGQPNFDYPVPLFLPFAASYDLDIVLTTKHPDWDMHEYARVSTPEGPVWIAKDARASNGNQLIVADIPTLHTWLPELPLPRKKSPLKVTDESTDELLDLRFEYENHDGEEVVATYRGKPPTGEPQSKRNGPTLGHSRNQVLAVLDLSHREFGDEAKVTYDGEDYGLERAAGLVPLKLAVQQTQGGIAEGRYALVTPEEPPTAAGECDGEPTFVTAHEMGQHPDANLVWHVEQKESTTILRQCGDLRTLRYDFIAGDDALSLVEASVIDWRGNTKFHVAFSPALPDPRRKFDGTVESRFVMDVGEQRNHAIGSVSTRWKGDAVEMTWTSTEPRWVAERCARTEMRGKKLATRVWPCEE